MKFVCPVTKIEPATRDALNCTGVDWTEEYVGGSDQDYFKLLSRLWAGGEDFVVVEQDIIVTPTIFSTFAMCPEQWCAGTYTYLNGQDYAGLGCVRFRKELCQALPDLMERVGQMSNSSHPQKHWCTNDAWMQTQLRMAGRFVHVHEHVGHLHDWPTHGCVPRW